MLPVFVDVTGSSSRAIPAVMRHRIHVIWLFRVREELFASHFAVAQVRYGIE